MPLLMLHFEIPEELGVDYPSARSYEPGKSN